MRFEWDESKDAANRQKHGIGLDHVRRFDFVTALRIRDERYDYGEERWRSIGYIGDRLHVIVYTERADAIRLISARKANRRERAFYERKREEAQAARGLRRES